MSSSLQGVYEAMVQDALDIRPPPAYIPPPLAHAAAAPGPRPDFQVRDIKSLLTDYPHLRDDSDCKELQLCMRPKSTKRKTGSGNAAVSDVNKSAKTMRSETFFNQHYEQLATAALSTESSTMPLSQHVNPWPQQVAEQLMQQVCTARFYFANPAAPETAQEDFVKRLQEGAMYLPLFTASYESKLLHEAGEFRHHEHSDRLVSYPACQNGTNCLAYRMPRFEGQNQKPMTLMQMMFQSEYDEWWFYGSTPKVSRPCLVCIRDALMIWILFLRAQGLATDRAVSEFEWSNRDDLKQTIHQLYRNHFDADDGYRRECVMKPEKGETLPIIEPFAVNSFSMMLCRQYPHTGQRYLDSSAMHYRAPGVVNDTVLEHAGETLQDFSNGAGLTKRVK